MHLSEAYCQAAKSIVQSNTNDICYTIKMEKECFSPFEPIILSTSVSNVSDVTISISTMNRITPDKYMFSVFNTTHNLKSALTEYGKNEYINYNTTIIDNRRVTLYSGKGRFLNPKEIYCKSVHLNRLYDMTLSGEYIVSASYSYYDYSQKKPLWIESIPSRIIINENHFPVTKNEKEIDHGLDESGK